MGRMKMPAKGQKFFYGKYKNNNQKSTGSPQRHGDTERFIFRGHP